ncbi:MAG: ABC transporter substrate-binding protein [Nitrososphaerales archaeon]
MPETFSNPKEVPPEARSKLSRRELLGIIGGLVVGGAIGAAATYVAAPKEVVKEVAKTVTVPGPTVTVPGPTVTVPGPTVTVTPGARPVPTTPLKIGCQTFMKGGNAPLGVPLYEGLVAAAEEINKAGGILGRKVEVIVRDEAGTDETVKEYKRLVLEDKIDLYIGLISSANTPAVAPHAEELKCLSLFIDGCTDVVFDVVDRNPVYVFRNHFQSPDGLINNFQLMRLYKRKTGKLPTRFAYIHPDYGYGRLVHAHARYATDKVMPENVNAYEAFVKFPGTTDFSAYITKMLEVKPDVVLSSEWGGDFKAFYKQALGYGYFKAIPVFISTLSHGTYPEFLETDYPEGIGAGVHANYWFEYPLLDQNPVNKYFVDSYFAKWKRYPNFEAEGAWTMLWAFKGAVEEIYAKIKGGWPETEEIVPILERWAMVCPAGVWQIRKDNHNGYKDAISGVSINDPKLGFNKLTDPYYIRVDKISAPPRWQLEVFDPKGPHPTATADWIFRTWKKGELPDGVTL